MSSVGGSRQSAQNTPRRNTPLMPWTAIEKYNPPAYGRPQSTSRPKAAIAASSIA